MCVCSWSMTNNAVLTQSAIQLQHNKQKLAVVLLATAAQPMQCNTRPAEPLVAQQLPPIRIAHVASAKYAASPAQQRNTDYTERSKRGRRTRLRARRPSRDAISLRSSLSARRCASCASSAARAAASSARIATRYSGFGGATCSHTTVVNYAFTCARLLRDVQKRCRQRGAVMTGQVAEGVCRPKHPPGQQHSLQKIPNVQPTLSSRGAPAAAAL